jgi:alanyl-tRNA synthetase
MSERLYYLDAYCRRFEGTVTRALAHEGRPAAVLDRSAFYPTSGGQPFDVGRLGEVQVVETVDAGDEVVHVLAGPLDAGTAVVGEIDWARRFDHMQQHTGQHMLSAAFDRLSGARTVGFHMGADVSTIDLAREVTAAEIEAAVDEANHVVWEDRAVNIRFASPEEAASLPLRKEPVRDGPLRLVEVEGFDLSACGGTHVARTGAVGVIAATGSERLRGGSRVTFVCGRRVVGALRVYRDAVVGSMRALSVVPAELPAAVERLQMESRDLQKQLRGMQGQLATHEGAHLAARASDVGGVGLLVETVTGWDGAGLKALAAAATAGRRLAVVLVSPGPPLAVVVACSAGSAVDANAVLQQLVRRFGGRGGGKRELAQGGGFGAPAEEIASAAREMLRESLSL